MSTLSEAIAQFHPRCKKPEDIEPQFARIALAAMNEGYFLINGKTRIYPVEIEFYLYGERKDDPEWMKDYNMYHKGKNVPYFPKEGSIFPHRSGVDFTFENEEEEYRASFLIRAYKSSLNDTIEKHPTYLWEEMFGENTIAGGGLNIVWVDETAPKYHGVTQDTRVNLNRKNAIKDPMPWRFIRNDINNK